MKYLFRVASLSQKALFDHEIKGQLSDGLWENTRPLNHWRPWSAAEVVVAAEGESLGRNFAAKSDYDLTRLMQNDIVRARMLTTAKLVMTFGEPLYAVLSSLYDSIGNWKGLADYGDKRGTTDEEDAIRTKLLQMFPTKERLESVRSCVDNQIYSRRELLQDLKELKSAMRKVLPAVGKDIEV